jgi:hypothetical protein
MKQTYGINISIKVEGKDSLECDRAAFYYKDVIRTKLHNQLKSKKMYKDLIAYEVELPNLQNEPPLH